MNSLACGLLLLSALCATATAQLSGIASSNPSGGQDVNLMLGKSFGTPEANLGGGLFASGNTLGGPVTTGALLAANSNGHGVSLQHSNTPGVGSTFGQNAHVNLLQSNDHSLGASAFHSRTNLENGFNFDKYGGALNYDHALGHSLSVGASRIPQLDMNTLSAQGKANLWSSADRASTLDLTGGISKNFGGPLNGQLNKNIGLGFTHRFSSG